MKPRRRIARPQAQDYVTRQLQQGIALGGLRFSVTSQSSNREPPMSPMGQEPTSRCPGPCHAIDPKADIRWSARDVR